MGRVGNFSPDFIPRTLRQPCTVEVCGNDDLPWYCYRTTTPCASAAKAEEQLILIRLYSSIKSRRGSRECSRRLSSLLRGNDYPAALVTPRWSPFPETNCRLNGGRLRDTWRGRRDPLSPCSISPSTCPCTLIAYLFSRTLFFWDSSFLFFFSRGGHSSRESRWKRRAFSGKFRMESRDNASFRFVWGKSRERFVSFHRIRQVIWRAD